MFVDKVIPARCFSCMYFSTSIRSDYYYLENGLFATVTDSADPVLFRQSVRRFASCLQESMRMGRMEVETDMCLAVFRCPEDFTDYDRMMSFVYSFTSFLPAGGTITFLEDGSDDGKSGFLLRNDIDRIISDALADNRFEMYYQPIYSVAEKRFRSAEALIRLYDDRYGFISPQLLIDAAERNGTIIQIGDFVLDSVCRFTSDCLRSGLDLDFVELNLSMKQCVQVDLKDKVLSFLNKYSLAPDRINLEITEGSVSADQDIVEENIRILSEYGISFSLDDYGTGYSNLSRLISLPFRIVKIDRSMTEMVFDERIHTVLKHTIKLLKDIGISVVIEGVETKEVFDQFVALGADYIQGYYFSRPIPENDFAEFIRLHSGT